MGTMTWEMGRTGLFALYPEWTMRRNVIEATRSRCLAFLLPLFGIGECEPSLSEEDDLGVPGSRGDAATLLPSMERRLDFSCRDGSADDG